MEPRRAGSVRLNTKFPQVHLPELRATAEPLPGDNDETVARYPADRDQAPGHSSDATTGDLSGVDLQQGSSIVVPASHSDNSASDKLGKSDVSESNDSSQVPPLKGTDVSLQAPSSATAYFMKPMPQKRGSSISSGDAGTATDAATRLWQSLTAENDDGEIAPEPLRLEHFEIDRLIGRGGMGAVFAARDLRLNRTVALKILAPEHTASKSSLDRFRNEARAAAKLDHDNISRVHYLGGQLAEGTGQPFANTALPFIALEFVEGPNVRELIRQKGPLPAGEVLRVALQLAAALRETSACGVVHRDIKPSNVIITPEGRAKLVDLGLARTDDPEASNELTVAGTTLGTFDYISPEQAKDPRTVDVRSDIYSLGCTLFHMAVGQAPYPDGTMLQKLLDHQGGVAPDARSLNHRVPVALSELVKRMMSADINERPQSADELLAETSAVASGLGIRPLAGESVIITRNFDEQYADEGWRRYLGWIVMAVVLGVIAIFSDQLSAPARPAKSSAAVGESRSTDDSASRSTTSSPADLQLELPLTNLDTITGPAKAPPVSRPIAGASAAPQTTAEQGVPTTTAIAATQPTASTTPKPVVAQPMLPDSTTVSAVPADSSLTPSPQSMPLSDDSSDAESTPSAIVSDPFVLQQRGNEVAFATLEEAILAAGDGATIEIRRGGSVGVVDRLIRIAEKSIEIIAAPELTSRPVIRLTEPLTTSPTGVRLFELSNGGLLRFYDIDLDVIIPPKPSSLSWSVFTLGEGCTVELDGSSVTVHNAGAASSALFQVVANSSDASSIASIVLDQCLIRGETTLLRTDGQCSIEAPISEAAIAIRGPVLDLRPSKMPDPDRTTKELSIHIDESTLIVAEGSQFQVSAGESDRIARVRVTSDDSVFALLNWDHSLVSMQGDLYEDEFQDLFSWDGSKNHFALENLWTTSAFGTLVSPDSVLDFDFAKWVAHWGANSQDEQQVTIATVGESLYATGERELSRFTVGDFAPVDSGANPIRRGSGAKRPGVPWNQLFVPDSAEPVPSAR